ncbi:hypothetical protein [Candidatus Amarolinea dominans]|uniref:hypothetical protein n=1 Tax=Candidatus Amarolinea dominans TaxID=3140696 RepID=UPI0031CC9571
MLTDRSRQFLQGFAVERLAWLTRIGSNGGDFDFDQRLADLREVVGVVGIRALRPRPRPRLIWLMAFVLG